MADPYKIHTRHTIRLEDYDYTQDGAYFITICTHERQCLFGQITNESINLSSWGKIVHQCWNDIPNHYPQVDLDEFVIMPNHIHGILTIRSGMIYHATTNPQTRRFSKPIAGSISSIVGTFKAGVTRQINRTCEISLKIWQRNFYEHIIQSEEDLYQIRYYIQNNIANWQKDSLFTG